MDSSWRRNIVTAGWDNVFRLVGTQLRPEYLLWARLITPVVILGVTYHSVIQNESTFGVIGWLSRSDLSTYDPSPLDRFIDFGFGFPYGFEVEPDVVV